MKNSLVPILFFSLLLSLSVSQGQDPAAGANYAAVQQVKLSPEQLDELVSPIALYPDPLVALILPASTAPTDVVLAARYVKNGGDVSQVDSQNWDPSVKSLTRYPDVLNMMDENLDWTNQLGAAVISQQGDVMQAIQNQRAKASALGNLTTTPQQQVVVEKQIIQIVPADPQIIYVPQYNPQVVYVQSAPAYSPFISFGIGFAMGAWLTNDCDWYNRGFYVNNWSHNGWHGYPRYNNVNVNINRNTYWKPNPHRPPPRPPYVPNRPNYGDKQTMPAFRQPPQGGWNGGNNRTQPVQANRPAGVTPGVANPQAKPNRLNPAPSALPGAKSPTVTTPQNKPGQPQPGTIPNANQNPRPGSWGNNNQNNQGTREDVKKDRPQGNPGWNGQQPNQNRPVTQPVSQPVKTPQQQQPAVAPRPQSGNGFSQPSGYPQTSPWKNPSAIPQTPKTRPIQQPTKTPQTQQHKAQPRPAASPQVPQQSMPQQQRPSPRAQDQKASPQPRDAGQGQGQQRRWGG